MSVFHSLPDMDLVFLRVDEVGIPIASLYLATVRLAMLILNLESSFDISSSTDPDL
jgi:hypothetical protein